MVAAEEAKLKEIQAESAPKENGNGHVAETEMKKDDVAMEKLDKVESKKRAREEEEGQGEEPASKKADIKAEAETKKDDVAAEKLEKVESKKRAREDEDGEGEEPADKKADTKTEAVEAAA